MKNWPKACFGQKFWARILCFGGNKRNKRETFRFGQNFGRNMFWSYTRMRLIINWIYLANKRWKSNHKKALNVIESHFGCGYWKVIIVKFSFNHYVSTQYFGWHHLGFWCGFDQTLPSICWIWDDKTELEMPFFHDFAFEEDTLFNAKLFHGFMAWKVDLPVIMIFQSFCLIDSCDRNLFWRLRQ